jgi:hypothetical protein
MNLRISVILGAAKNPVGFYLHGEDGALDGFFASLRMTKQV